MRKLAYALLIFAAVPASVFSEESNNCSMIGKMDFAVNNSYEDIFLLKETTHFLEFSEKVIEISVGTTKVAVVSATENGNLYLTTKNEGLTNLVARSITGKMFRAIIRVGTCNLKEGEFSQSSILSNNLDNSDRGQRTLKLDRNNQPLDLSKSDMKAVFNTDYQTIDVYNGEKKETLECLRTCRSTSSSTKSDKSLANGPPSLSSIGVDKFISSPSSTENTRNE